MCAKHALGLWEIPFQGLQAEHLCLEVPPSSSRGAEGVPEVAAMFPRVVAAVHLEAAHPHPPAPRAW